MLTVPNWAKNIGDQRVAMTERCPRYRGRQIEFNWQMKSMAVFGAVSPNLTVLKITGAQMLGNVYYCDYATGCDYVAVKRRVIASRVDEPHRSCRDKSFAMIDYQRTAMQWRAANVQLYSNDDADELIDTVSS